MSRLISHSRRTADGTIWTFLAEALILPTGLISAAFLTRRLGSDGYGLFTLASTVVALVGTVVSALFVRGSIRLVSEADDWHPVATTIVRIHAVFGMGSTLFVGLLAAPIARLLDEPQLTPYLILFSLEPLFFALSRAHRSVLIGTGLFRAQAGPVAIRQVARLVLIVVLVESGLSVTGAVLGVVGSTALELIAYRRRIRPHFVPRSGYSARRVWMEATPIFFATVFLAFFSRVDILALTALGLPVQEAGYYGAAQNLSIVPALFATSFVPLLLSTLTRMAKSGPPDSADLMSRNAMRLVFGMLPFAAMASGASHEIVPVIFGSTFAPAGPILAWLVIGKAATVMVSIAAVILLVAGRQNLNTFLAGSMLAAGVVGHILVIPRFGSIGAAWVTTAVEVAGAVTAMGLVYRLRGVWPPLSTVVRTMVVAGVAWWAAAFWPVPGLWVVAKCVAIVCGIAVTYAWLGEFTPTELAWARSLLRSRPGTRGRPRQSP